MAEGKDAIISAYNPGWLNPEIATLITENYPKILEAAKKSGVKYIAQPGGSVRDDNVIDTCNKYGIAMCFTGIRLFHH